ncbi:hypothetical protein NYE67_20630 [Solibacillus sp. FSL W8-0474]|uniref:hypothetical protein n=1 Tax=Solibacillus sp. FSL W8-0474 TaxID=2975336 RepID=UPI0030F6903D
MKFLDKVLSFFRKPAAVEEVAKGFEQAYQKQQQDKEMAALLDWVEHDKPRTIAGVNAPAIWFDEIEVKTPNYNKSLAIKKYKTQKKNWAHWKKRGNR